MTDCFGRPETLAHALAQHAQSTADSVALRFLSTADPHGIAVTYRELDARARAVAAELARRCGAADRAVLLLPSGPDYVAAFFGCLYAGVIAVPAYPPESTQPQHLVRLLSILADARPAVILTSRPLAAALHAGLQAAGVVPTPSLLVVDELETAGAGGWRGPPLAREAIAFLQYTSGSTSDPKGVQVGHGNLEENEWLIRNAYAIGRGDVIVSWLPLYHDMGLIGGLLQAIYSGVPVILMAPRYFLERPVRWLEAIDRFGGTVSGGPDFAYRLCHERIVEGAEPGLDLSRWRLAFSGAEPIRSDTLQAFAARFASSGFRPTAFLASYGLAEATLLVSCARPGQGAASLSVGAAALGAGVVETGDDITLVGCGTSLPEHPLAIVEPESGETLPEGRVGEICVSGPSIAQGYWRKREDSAQTFVQRDGRTWLRTGDLGFLRHGELFVTGRIKDMLIIRGQNVYPQDVERTIEQRVEAVRKGRVAVFAVTRDGREGLGVAAEVSRRLGAESSDALIVQIRQVVAEAHQEAPSVIALLNPGALPKTSSGKLQRSACRAQLASGALDARAVFREGDPADGAAPAGAAPTTGAPTAAAPAAPAAAPPVAERVAALWRRTLNVETLAAGDNFFALGGNSVLAVQLIADLSAELAVELDLPTLFDAPTLAQFSAAVEERCTRTSAPAAGIPRAARDGAIPLSASQQRFWLLWQLDPRSVAYNIPGALRLRGELDRDAVRAAFAVLFARHESLRTTFYEEAGRACQRIDPHAEWRLHEEDLTDRPAEERNARLDAIREEEARTRFDLERGPLVRVKLVAVDEQEHLLLVTLHHIVADGWSLNILLEEFARVYAARVQDLPGPLRPLPIQYADYAAWQHSDPDAPEQERQLAYWRAELGDAPEGWGALPLDGPRAPAPSAAERLTLQLDRKLAPRLRQLAAAHGASPFMLLLAAFHVLLHRFGGHADSRVGVPVAQRGRPELEPLVGLLINTLVMRATIDPAQEFAALLAAVRDTVLRAQAHRDVPFEAVSAALAAGVDAPLFDVMFNYRQHDPDALRRLPGLLADELPWHSREAKYPLELHAEEDRRGNLRLAFDYAVDLLQRSTVERLADHYVRLLEAICARPHSPVGELAATPPSEHRRLREWGTGAAVAVTALLPERLTRQAQATPHALALVHAGGRLDYAELDARANGLAWWLRRRGVGPEVCVGLLAGRSLATQLALLAVVKAGGAYVPLEPDYPNARIEQMIRSSGVRLLLGEPGRLAGLDVPGDVEVHDLSDLDTDVYRESPPPSELHPENLVYVLHTSGSTGVPKGVAVTHGALAARLEWMRTAYGFGAQDVLLQKAPLGFDVSAWECFLPLICGSRLVLAAPTEHRDPACLVRRITEHGVTAIHFVPAMWQQFIDEPEVGECRTLRHVFSGGEALAPQLERAIRERLPHAVLHNRYGPTETTINVTHWRSADTAPGEVPIGEPLAGVVCELHHAGLELAPIGAHAELFIGGSGLARGYQRQPSLTAERFVPAEDGGRRYRSGDLARWQAAGVLEYRGRDDRQVKLRGFRIETEEIRRCLLAQHGVGAAAVALHEGAAGPQLVAWCCVAGDETEPQLGERLRRALRALLPAYMVPTQYVRLAALPLAPSGKVDLRALPAPVAAVREPLAPRTQHEQRLAAIWCEVLGLASVGLDDDFFALGGHSLLATQIVSRTRQAFDIELPLRSLFEASRFDEFAARVADARAEGRPDALGTIPKVDRRERIPLSYAQQRMWFLWQLDPASPAYNVGGMARLRGPLDGAAFERALRELLQRHESLRTTFPSEQGRPFQRIAEQTEFALQQLDFSTLTDEQRRPHLQRIADEQAHAPFDLERGPLLRACLVRSAEHEHYLLLTLHHIVTEGWAMDVFARELAALYEAFAAGRTSPLAPLPVQYPDYSAWQRRWLAGGEMQRQLAYWSARLGGEQPVLELPTDRPRPPVQSHRGDLHRFDLERELSEQVRAFCAQRGMTLFMAVTAALAALLYRYGGQRDLRIGVPVANRIRPESEGLIGAFLNIQVLRVELDGQQRGEALLEQVRQAVIDGQSHQDLPFDQLVEALRPERSAAYNPLFQVMCNVQRWTFQQTREIAGGLSVEYLVNDARATKFDLNLEVTDIDAQLRCCLTYSTDLFERDTIERMARHWRNVLRALLENPDRRIAELAMYDVADAPLARAQGFRRAVDDAPVHVLFERRVEAQPQAPAVTLDGSSWTYAALNARANRIAHRLQALGVGPEIRVGLMMRRSLDLVATVFAVLKAGGAYVPLDPEHPLERRRYMVADSGVAVLLTDAASSGQAAALGDAVRVLNLDEPDELLGCDEANPVDRSRPELAAYLIYTSGSTGRPKGVTVSHGPLSMHCQTVGELFGETPSDRELHFYSMNFDAASERLLVPLLHGAHLVLRAHGQWDTQQICELIRRERIDVLGFTPSYGRQLAQWLTGRGEQLPVRLVIVGGEALTAEHRDEIARAFAPDRFFNAYGPTETVVMPLACEVSGLAADGTSLPIGAAVGARSLRVFDADLAALPPGAVGELYVGGEGLARGYHERPSLSAERFVPDPFDAGGGRLYRTGDRVRERRDGRLEYVGRIDQQVKVRGFRIELGEIEAQLQAHEAVREAAVVATEGRSSRQLIAYVVASEHGSIEHDDDTRSRVRERLKAHLHAALPDYMVPSQILFVERIPLTANGKLDRAALPAPDLPLSAEAPQAPRSETERVLEEIWREVLGVARVGIDENFFELGGDSILSIQVVSRARMAGIKFTPKDLFHHQTIRGLAAAATLAPVEAAAEGAETLTGDAPLLPIQHWFFELGAPQPGRWSQSVLLQARSRLLPRRLRAALQELVEHHDGLRLRFRRDEHAETPSWSAAYQPQSAPQDLLLVGEADTESTRRAAIEQAHRAFDLERGPLLRAVLFRGRPDKLLLVIHHLVVDGVSWRVLIEDLEILYRRHAKKRPILALSPKSASQRDWAMRLSAHAAGDALREERAWWQRHLDGAPAAIPRDDPAGANLERHGRAVNRHLGSGLTRKLLRRAPHAYRTRIDELLLAALAQVLCQWSDATSALIEVEGHGRDALLDGIDLGRSVGWFTSLHPVHLRSDGLLERRIVAVKEQLRSVPNRGVGFGVLRYLADDATRAAMAALALPRITFNYLGQVDRGGARALFLPAREELAAKRHDDGAPLPNWLGLDCRIASGELWMRWTFSDRVYRTETVEQLADAFRHELIAVIDHCAAKRTRTATPSDFPLVRLTQAQLDALPVPSSAIEDIYPLTPMQEGLLLHTLLEPGTGIYYMQDRYSIDSELDLERFDQAWRAVVARHEALRASFAWNAGEAMLQIIHRQVSDGVEFLDWSDAADSQHEARLQRLLEEEREAGFDLLTKPPFRLRLIRLAADRHWFIMSNHHILIDAWCRSLLMGDFLEIYAALDRGTRPALDSAPRYRDFIVWLDGRDRASSRDWWRGTLGGFDRPSYLPSDRAIPLDRAPGGGGQRVGDRYRWLGPDDNTRLRQLAQSQQLTVNTFAQAAWALVLRRYGGVRDVLFGVTVAGRPAELPQMQRAVGLFINTVPLRVTIPEDDGVTVDRWLHDLLAHNLAMREHEHVPLVEIQDCSELPKGRPLFDSLFVFENAPVEHAVLDRAKLLNARSGSGRTHTNYPLTVVCYPGDTLGLHLSYDQRFFDQPTIDRLLEDFERLLLALVEGFHGSVARLPLVTEAERRFQLEDWNATAADHPLDAGYVPVFEARVAAEPGRIVARCRGESWTYAELDRRANRLGRQLVAQGVRPDGLVGLLAERSLALLGMMIGTLKAGAGFLSLDSAHPRERLLRILESSRAPVLVCDRSCAAIARDLLSGLPEATRPRLLDWDAVQAQAGDAPRPAIAVTGRHLAYAIYTSGSTGEPKGVLVEQAGMLNNQLSKVPYLQLGAHDVIAQTASQSFDISVWQFLTAPLCGACVEIVPEPIARDPAALLQHVVDTGITILECVPAVIAALLPHASGDVAPLRYLLPTGEALPPEVARAWLERHPQVGLVNAYGPAECSDDVALFRVDRRSAEGARVPIGLATDNNRLYVLDERLSPLQAGAVGELAIAGTGVGRGYLGDPARTAERFVPAPFGAPGERLYRSGDRAARRADGVLEYLGRVDHQVKVRGFRIELGEIETCLRALTAVHDAAVVTHEGPGGNHLVGYIVPAAGEWLQSPGTRPETGWLASGDHLQPLQRALREQLPDYMVPAHWMLLERLPLNTSGKVDRNALPPPTFGRGEHDGYVAPRNALERTLVEIWREVLDAERVGVTDDFFRLGGHSLLATQIVARAQRELQRSVPLRAMFECRTVEDLAEYIESLEGSQIGEQQARRLDALMESLEAP